MGIGTAEKESIAVVPIGIPLLAGPGAISTIVVQAHRGSTLAHYVILGAEILFVAGVVWLCFRSAHFIASALGKTGINVITRIMGLIIAAIGVEFIANGMRQLFPALN
jgi:multiple antibiotic resistance protein